MTDFAWFPVDRTVVPRYVWIPRANWISGALWTNISNSGLPPHGNVPGAGDAAYIMAASAFPFDPPLPLPLGPYPVTVVLSRATATVATLGLAGVALGGPALRPTLDIEASSMFVTGSVVDHFTKAFPDPIGPRTFSGGGTIRLGNAASLEIGGTIDAGIDISFADLTRSRLLLDDVGVLHSGAFAGTMRNFSTGNLIDLSSVAFAGASEAFSAGVLTISLLGIVQATIRFAGSYVTTDFRLVDNGGGRVEIVTCFAAGTRILTPGGEVAVEDLRPGDDVVTLRDGDRTTGAVTWIGRRRLDPRRDPANMAPVRIRRDAMAAGVPARDLRVSPDHCLYLDGALVPARLLVNGATIAPETERREVTYFHVELARHAILLAEGLEAESYLDTGNRAFFANAGAVVALHPAPATNPDAKTWRHDACAPLAVGAAHVEPIWRRLAARAEALGFECPMPQAQNADVGLRLLAGERVIRPAIALAESCRFVLPAGTRSVRLLSHADTPSRACPWLDDRRRLGVCISRIVAHTDAGLQEMPVDHPALSHGWWATERVGPAMSRWTDGDAAIPLPVGTRMVEFQILATHGVTAVGQEAA